MHDSRTFQSIIVFIAVLGLSGCAMNQTPSALGAASPQGAAVTKTSQAKKKVEKVETVVAKRTPRSKVTCRNERVTGSRMKKRVCLSAKERDQLEDEAVKALKNATLKTPSR